MSEEREEPREAGSNATLRAFIESVTAFGKGDLRSFAPGGLAAIESYISRYTEDLCKNADKLAKSADPNVHAISSTYVDAAAARLAGAPKSKWARHLGEGGGGILSGVGLSALFGLWIAKAQGTTLDLWMLVVALGVMALGVVLYIWGIWKG